MSESIERAAEEMEDVAFRLIGRDLGTIYRNDIARATVAAALSDREGLARRLYEVRTGRAVTEEGARGPMWTAPGNPFRAEIDALAAQILGGTDE